VRAFDEERLKVDVLVPDEVTGTLANEGVVVVLNRLNLKKPITVQAYRGTSHHVHSFEVIIA
jgi:hypothetical protein